MCQNEKNKSGVEVSHHSQASMVDSGVVWYTSHKRSPIFNINSESALNLANFRVYVSSTIALPAVETEEAVVVVPVGGLVELD